MARATGKEAKASRWRAKGRTAEAQFETARRRIQEAQKAGATELDLSDLPRLNELPPEFSSFKALQTLGLKGTQVADLTPLSGLTSLQSLDLAGTPVADLAPLALLASEAFLRYLSLDGTRVADLSPIKRFITLQSLSFSRTQVADLIHLVHLRGLQSLIFAGTKVVDLSPLADLVTLRNLSVRDTHVDDLGPLARLTRLENLDISGTKVLDLWPLADMTRMQDAAAGHQVNALRRGGLLYGNTPASKVYPFDRWVALDQPACTVETINEVRRQRGQPVHYPKNYVPFPPFPPLVEQPEADADQDARLLVQRPASHSFSLRGGRIEAQDQPSPPRHPDVASDIRDEVSSKAGEASSRLANCNAPSRIISTVSRLTSSLGQTISDVRAGILQMRFRSLEADIAAFDTVDGRRELPEDALAMLRDLASSVEDLMGCFPQLAEIEAERLAQRLKETDVPQVIDALLQIRKVAEASEAVAPSAVEALKAGEPELEHDSEIIDSSASEPARTAAMHARDRTAGYMLLVYRNFVAGAVKAGSELAGLGVETWASFRKEAPDQFANAGVALVIATLVNALLGPTAAVGAFAVSFKPLRERAKQVADKLASMAKRSRKVAKEGNE